MARVIRKRKKIDAWKTKTLYEVFAPRMFGEAKIGETLASDASGLIGRVLETTVRDLTNDFSKQHIKLRFQIADVKGDKAYTKFKGHSLSRDYMRSQIRRKTTRVERVTDVETKDNQKLRVKTIALAVGRAQTAQEKLIRKIMADRVAKAAKKLNLDQFVQEVVLGKISSDIYKAANKIYPLKRVEVRKVKVLEKKPGIEVKEAPQGQVEK
ncbi:MAG: 30S ribosomal protein S3ae [Candidatus Hydrothermarchaeota archaeon]|nr:30S ribosomal protein S3ae [Candidatus Hydrothermarchaeota archaeon]